jgi:hypothetical protein
MVFSELEVSRSREVRGSSAGIGQGLLGETRSFQSFERAQQACWVRCMVVGCLRAMVDEAWDRLEKIRIAIETPPDSMVERRKEWAVRDRQ